MNTATNSWLVRMFVTDAPRAVLLIRLAVGLVFASEGIQKFLFPSALGAGRFAKIGIPWPELMGPFVGVVELVGDVAILLGLATRPAALLLLCDMLLAICRRRSRSCSDMDSGGFADPSVARHGFWSMAHESRTDLAMLLGALFLARVGAGTTSIDATLTRRLAR